MKKLQFTFLLILIFGLAIGCKNEKAEAILLKDEVIAIHDEVMPKTMNIYGIKNKLADKLADGSIDSTLVFELIKKLDTADEAMRIWMDEYDEPDFNNPTEAIEYLDGEKVRILKVQELTNAIFNEVNPLIDDK